ncbi:GGDEF domain-containing protein [Novipirellula herctigrandis]
MLLDLAIAFSCAGVGISCGWVMHGLGWIESSDEAAVGQISRVAVELKQVHDEQDRLSIVAERLRDYALKMAIDVDEHQHNVQEVSDSLTGEKALSAEAMCAAVNRLIEANESMQTKLHSAQQRIHAQAEQLESAERRAQTDALTSVSNRGAFDEHLARRHALGAGRAGTLMLLDVDHFKKFNDEYGHRAGDEVLKVVAQMLHARLKSYGIVARFGGEEFAAIIDGYSVDECKKIVESARVAIGQQSIEFEGNVLNVNASIGVAEQIDGDSVEQWIERADAAMYHAKNHGRNCGFWMNENEPTLISLDGKVEKKTRPAPKQEPKREEKSFLIPEVDEPIAADGVKETVADTIKSVGKKKASTQKTESEATETPNKPEATKNDSPNQEPAPQKTPAKNEEAPSRGAFASLPGRAALAGSFAELQERSKAIGKSTHIMALHVTGEPVAGSMRALLQIVRATLLSVDRIGAEDASTLLVCIPGIDANTAQQRLEQIQASAASIQFGDSAKGTVEKLEIGLVQVSEKETFEQSLSRLLG